LLIGFYVLVLFLSDFSYFYVRQTKLASSIWSTFGRTIIYRLIAFTGIHKWKYKGIFTLSPLRIRSSHNSKTVMVQF